MRAWTLLPPLVGLGFALLRSDDSTYVLLLTGDMNGQLTPCGCTKPMSGGIRRMATAVRSLQIPDRTLLLMNGGMVTGASRQEELKMETLVQVFDGLDVTAINVGSSEVGAGRSALMALGNLARGKLVGSSMAREAAGSAVSESITVGPFIIGGGAQATDAKSLTTASGLRGLRAILMWDGGRSDAERIAKLFPNLALIQYRSGGKAARSWSSNTLLVTPGEKGKGVVRLAYRRGKFISYSSIDLGPEYKDDPRTSTIFDLYLKRVSDEDLLSKRPRTSSDEFVGSAECGSCHQSALRTWQRSAHSRALEPLKSEMEHRDPDCVPCHTVGLSSEHGFRSEASTPHLANVGCESCHGAGKMHAQDPKSTPFAKVRKQACTNCHTSEQSPAFQFDSYWQRIRH